MAASYGSGSQSPPQIGRPVERVFEEAQFTGEIYLNGRKLRDFPQSYNKYDLSDTICVDVSKNRLSEFPPEFCSYLHVERINCYHNVIKSIPDSVAQLQILTHINLSRNQLTVLTPALCMLGTLEVLCVSNNKLVSLPEEIGRLESLMDLDVSCNEISHLPHQIGDLSSLRSLNLRRNFLVELPIEISRLQLTRLDISSNRIEKIPTVFRKMECLEQLCLDNNPLSSPPAYICTKGRKHIMKYLHIEAVKEDRKRGVMINSDSDMKRFVRKSLPPQQSSDEMRNMLGVAPEAKWKRHTVLSNDSGYNSTGDVVTDKGGWQSGEQRLRSSKVEVVELKRQKTEYDRKKRQAEQIRVQQEEEEEREKEEKRKAALKVQEEHRLLMEKQQEEERLRLQEEEKQRRYEETQRKMKEEEEENRKREEELYKLQEAVRFQAEEEKSKVIPRGFSKMSESKSPVENNQANHKNAISSQQQRHSTGSNTSSNGERTSGSTAARTTQQYRRAVSDSLRKASNQQSSPTSAHVDSLNYINKNGVVPPDGKSRSRQSSTSTTPSVSPGPSPRNSISHLAKPTSITSPGSTTRSPVGSQSHLAKPKSSVPRAAGSTVTNGAAPSATSQAVRRTKAAGDRSNASSPVTARATRMAGPGSIRSALNPPTSSNPRRGSNGSVIDDDNKNKKGGSTPTEATTRLKSRLAEPNKHGSGIQPSGLRKTGQVDGVDNKRINSRPPTNTYGSARGRTGPAKTIEESALTIRRREEHHREEAEQMDRLRQTVESRLRVTLPDNLADALRDGVVLCHLANQIRPRSVGSIHVPSPAVPKLTLAKCRRNVDNFLDACRKIGVDQEQICNAQDIFDEKGITRVAMTVAALVAIGTNPKQSAV